MWPPLSGSECSTAQARQAYGSKIRTSVMRSTGSAVACAATRIASGDGESTMQKLRRQSGVTNDWIQVTPSRALARITRGSDPPALSS